MKTLVFILFMGVFIGLPLIAEQADAWYVLPYYGNQYIVPGQYYYPQTTDCHQNNNSTVIIAKDQDGDMIIQENNNSDEHCNQ